MNIPQFKLNATNLTDDQIKEALEPKKGGKGFAPGNYRLKITEAQYHANKETGSIMSKGDPTWLNVSVVLVGAEGRNKKHYVQVPTEKITYTTEKGESTFMFQKFHEFMAALGIYIDGKNLGSVLKQYFTPEGLERLNGQELSVDIGFTGPYVKFIEQGKYQLVINNQPYAEGGEAKNFADSDSVVAFGAALNKRVQKFPEIVRFHAAPEKTQEQKAGNDGW